MWCDRYALFATFANKYHHIDHNSVSYLTYLLIFSPQYTEISGIRSFISDLKTMLHTFRYS